MKVEFVKNAVPPRTEKPRLDSKGWPSTHTRRPRPVNASPLRNSFIPEPGSPGDNCIFPFSRSTSSDTTSSAESSPEHPTRLNLIGDARRPYPLAVHRRGVASKRESFRGASTVRERTKSGSFWTQIFGGDSSTSPKRGNEADSIVNGSAAGQMQIHDNSTFSHHKSVRDAFNTFCDSVYLLCSFSYTGDVIPTAVPARTRNEHIARMLCSLSIIRKRICLLDWALNQANVHSTDEVVAYRAERDELRKEIESMEALHKIVKNSYWSA